MVLCREYYCYKLQIRSHEESILLHSSRLLQQYVVDMYVKIETARLDFFSEIDKMRFELKYIKALQWVKRMVLELVVELFCLHHL